MQTRDSAGGVEAKTDEEDKDRTSVGGPAEQV